MPVDNSTLSVRLNDVLMWSQGQSYVGFSKFDAFNTPLVRALVPDVPLLRAVVTAAWSRAPVNPRPLLGTQPDRNPKGIALFALARLRRFQVSGDEVDLVEARQLLAWLQENSAPGYSGYCWGYDHDWYGLHFAALKFNPNIVVTCNVCLAFLAAYEVEGAVEYLEVARSTVDFLLQDLAAPLDTEAMRSIGYVPGSDWSVLNINGLAAAVLVRVAVATGEQALMEEARRLIAFLADKQTDYGAWHYAWPSASSNVKHDNYHSGNVLEWFMDYRHYSKDQSFDAALELGLAFYRRRLFTDEGLPKWRHTRAYPADAHSAGQALVTFGKASLTVDPGFLEDADRVARWSLGHLQHVDGWFYYQQGRWWKKRYTLMRWCNGWMAVGLATLLLARSRRASAKDTRLDLPLDAGNATLATEVDS